MKKEVKLQSISASERWLQCTQSLEYNQTFSASEASVYGSLIHEVCSLRLDEIFNQKDNSERIKFLKENTYHDKNDPSITANWNAGAEKIYKSYIDYALSLYNKHKPHKVLLEEKVDVMWYGYSKYGYIDLVMFCKNGVIIVDLKTGWNKVDVINNSQMLMYLLGLVQKYPELVESQSYIGEISICQPTVDNIVSQSITTYNLSTFYKNKSDKMQEIITGDLQYDPSEKACKYCDYRASCNARIKAGVL